MSIHPTALIEKGAQIGEGVHIGPYCVVGSNVTLKKHVRLISHVCVGGHTEIGEKTVLYPFSCIGQQPQDMKYAGEEVSIRIGSKCVVREYVTIHPGTLGGKRETRVGDHVLLMVGVHIAHDCIIGDHVVMANQATLGGHVEIGDYAVIGGLAAIHQFVHIGSYAMVGGMSGVEKDVIPYGMVVGERAHLRGLNLIGLKRRGFSSEEIYQLMDLYRHVFEEEGSLEERLASLPHYESKPTQKLIDFLKSGSKRSFCSPRK